MAKIYLKFYLLATRRGGVPYIFCEHQVGLFHLGVGHTCQG